LPKVLGLFGRIPEQGVLADAGFAPEDQHASTALAGPSSRAAI
jgi:hypothetical protein